MNYENIAVDVKSEDHRKIVIETSKGRLQTYYSASKRMMYLYGETLQVSMRADPICHSTDDRLGQPLELTRQIEGTVVLKDQLISVIGDSQSQSSKLKIVFQAVTPDGREMNHESEQTSNAAPSYTRAWVKCIRLNQRLGDESEWFAVCMVSPYTLDAIASAVASKTLCELTVGLIFKYIYIDDDNEDYWDDPRPVKNWYLRPNLRDNTIEFPEDAYGAVTYLDLVLGSVQLSEQNDIKLESPRFTPPTAPTTELQLDQQNTVFNLIATNIAKLRTVMAWVGGVLALILFVLAFK